jgi:activating signal cointegrator complex subunit 2
MKWDILRRVEEMEEAEAELLDEREQDSSKGKVKLRSDAVYDEDEIALGESRIRPLGDEESEADSFSGDSATESEPLDPETIIEQAYLRDPTVFYRDASTRRGRARIELRSLTGWADEQIEGWKVILERTVSFIWFCAFRASLL